MLTLHIDNLNAGPAGALHVTWCAPRAVLQEAARSGSHAWMVLETVPETEAGVQRPVERHVVPLRDGEAYPTFRRPGVNRVFGHIRFGEYSRVRNSSYLGNYSLSSINDTGTGWTCTPERVEQTLRDLREKRAVAGDVEPSEDVPEGVLLSELRARNLTRQQLDQAIEEMERELTDITDTAAYRGISAPVDVPAACFEKRLSPLMHGLVHYFWKGEGTKDYCGTVHRYPAFVPTLLWIALIAVPYRLIGGLLALAFGSLAPAHRAFRPIKYGMKAYWKSFPGLVWIPDDTKKQSLLRLGLAPLMPGMIAVGRGLQMWADWGWWNSLGWFGATLVWVALMAFIGAIVGIFAGLSALSLPSWLNPANWFRARPQALLTEQDIELLTCDPAGEHTPRPRERSNRPLRLRIAAHKATSCLPYQD